MPITAPPPKSASTFCADVAVAARAVVARRCCLPCRKLGAGPCRAPSERASRAPPSPPCDLTLYALRCPSPRRRPRARRPSTPTWPLPPAPSWRVDAARPVASSAPARAACRLGAPLARPRHHCDITLRAQRFPSPRRRPGARRPSAPTSPLPPAPSWRVDAARPVASSTPARAARRVSAPLALPRHHRDITLRAQRCPSPRRRPRARRPSAPTWPLPPRAPDRAVTSTSEVRSRFGSHMGHDLCKNRYSNVSLCCGYTFLIRNHRIDSTSQVQAYYHYHDYR